MCQRTLNRHGVQRRRVLRAVGDGVLMTRDDPMPKSQQTQFHPRRLFNINFALLWQGQSVSWLGSHVFYIAMILWIKEITGSAGVVGSLLMVSSIPGVVLGPIGGTFADRHPRKRIIVLTDTINGLAIVALAGVLLFVPEATRLTLALLFGVAVIGAVNNAFFAPAITAALPDIVPKERLAGANGMIQASMQVSQFIGQALGGVLFGIVGAPILFLFNGVTFLFSAVSESFISIPQPFPSRKRRRRSRATVASVKVDGGTLPLVLPVDTGSESMAKLRPFLHATLEGLRYVWRRPGLRELVLGGASLAFFAAPIVVLLPFFIEDVLGAGAEWYGFFLSVFGVGTLVGTIAAGALNLSGIVRRNLLIAVLFVQSASYLALGLIQSVGSAMAIAAVSGAATGFVGINVITIVQATTPSEIRGRAVSLMVTLSGSLAPIAMGLSGVIADLTGQNVPVIYAACGLGMMIVSVVLTANRQLRELVAYEQDAAIPAVQT